VVAVRGDVRNVVLVADDGHARARDVLGGAGAGGRDAVLLRLEVLGEVGVGDVVEQWRQAVVHERLGVRAGRRRDGAVLARGNDVEGGLRVVLLGGSLVPRTRCRHEDQHSTNDQNCRQRSLQSPLLTPAFLDPASSEDPTPVKLRQLTARGYQDRGRPRGHGARGRLSERTCCAPEGPRADRSGIYRSWYEA